MGLQTRGDHDMPYWPVQSTWTYKEVWVHPVARWIWLMRDLAGPALVHGLADSPVEFTASSAGASGAIQANPADGRFRAWLPEGKYTVRCHGEESDPDFLPAGTCHLDLRPGRILDFDISKRLSEDGELQIQVNARGYGRHRFSIRTDNLSLQDAPKELTLKRGSTGSLEWRGRIRSPDTSWIAVVIADDNPAIRKELMGAAWGP